MARAKDPYTIFYRNSQEEADALLTAHQQARILRDRTEALRDYQDTIAFERYLAELEWDR
jgi:hypothetical protein